MDQTNQILKILQKKKLYLKKALANTKTVRDDALSATQSWSDTTRNESEKMVTALEEKIEQIDKLIEITCKKQRKKEIWRVFETEVENKKINALLVPVGFGGIKVGKYTLVSKCSILGKKLLKSGMK